MRRRPKPQLDAAGNVLALPAKLAQFNIGEWPGTSDHHRWEHWWDARLTWAIENDVTDEILDAHGAEASQPRLTSEDLARLI